MTTYYLKTENVAVYPIAIEDRNGDIFITCPILEYVEKHIRVYNTESGSTCSVGYILEEAKKC